LIVPCERMKSARDRILHVIKVKGVSGAENHLLTLLPELNRTFDISLVFLVEPGNDMEDFVSKFKAHGIPVLRINMRYHLDPTVIWKIYYLIRKWKPHIVHTHLLHGDLYGISAALFTGSKILVSTKHGYDNYENTSVFYRLNGILGRWLDKVITISHALKPKVAEAEGISPSKMVTIHYGLDAEEYAALKDEGLARSILGVGPEVCILGTVGRLVPVKGYETLLEALAGLARDYRLLIMGDGPQRGALEKKCGELGISEKVVFLGFTSRVSAILSGIDLFVLPTLGEGFGLVLLEAMAHRLPIVSTNTMAVPEIVEDHHTGLLVPPRDVTALRRALETLIKDPARRRVMGEEGWKKLKNEFSVDRMVRETSDLYKDLLEKYRRGVRRN